MVLSKRLLRLRGFVHFSSRAYNLLGKAPTGQIFDAMSPRRLRGKSVWMSRASNGGDLASKNGRFIAFPLLQQSGGSRAELSRTGPGSTPSTCLVQVINRCRCFLGQ